MLAAMRPDVDQLSQAEAVSSLRWWTEAGVDQPVAEEARRWLKRAAAERPAATAIRVDLAAAPSMPTSLAEFHDWLAANRGLPLDRPGARRVAPHGPAGAALMLVSEAPGPEDLAAGRPIGGDCWQLIERMVRALGIAPERVYSAALSYAHVPGARLVGGALDQAAAILRHHIRLVAPERLLLLGDGPAQALLGEPLAIVRGQLRQVEEIPAIATLQPRFLIQRPADKLLAWQDLLAFRRGDDG